MSCKKYRSVHYNLFTQQIFAMYQGDFVVLFIFSKKKKCNDYGCKEFSSTIEIKEYALIMGNQFFRYCCLNVSPNVGMQLPDTLTFTRTRFNHSGTLFKFMSLGKNSNKLNICARQELIAVHNCCSPVHLASQCQHFRL